MRYARKFCHVLSIIRINGSFPVTSAGIKLGICVPNLYHQFYPNGGTDYVVDGTMKVDYFKIYEPKSCDADIDIYDENTLLHLTWNNGNGCYGESYNDYNSLPTNIYARNVILGREGFSCMTNNDKQEMECTYWPPVYNGEDYQGWFYTDSVEVDATNEIKIKPGFHAQQGSAFHAYILPCISNKSFDISDNSSSNGGTEDSIYYKKIKKQTEINKKISISVIPNPSQGLFTIQYSNGILENATIKLYNMLGSFVYEEKLKSQQTQQIDLSGLAEGIYYFRVENQEKSFSEKIVIEK